MTSNGSSVEETHKKVGGTKLQRGKGKPRHRFTKDELEILNQSFERNPYPDFTTREELANQMHCHICVVDNWYQNKRARMKPKEKQRLHATRNQNFLQSQPVLGYQDTLGQCYNNVTTQLSYTQQALVGRAGYFSIPCRIPNQEDGTGDSIFSSINMEPSNALEYQADVGSGTSPSFRPAVYLHPESSLQYFDRASLNREENQHTRVFLLHCVHDVQGKMQQQEEQVVPCDYQLYEGQQQNDGGYYLQQPQQPQNYQENFPFQDQFLMSQRHGDLGQQVPSLVQQQDPCCQSNGEALSSQMLYTSPSQIAVPLGQDVLQSAIEQLGSQTQQLWDERSAEGHDWA